MAAWPPSIPTNPVAGSFRPQPPDLVSRTQMEAGPAFQRRTATAGSWTLPGLRYAVNRTQLADFQSFWEIDIIDGSDIFDFDVPADWPVNGAGTTKQARLIEVYRITPRFRGLHWFLDVDLELLP